MPRLYQTTLIVACAKDSDFRGGSACAFIFVIKTRVFGFVVTLIQVMKLTAVIKKCVSISNKGCNLLHCA